MKKLLALSILAISFNVHAIPPPPPPPPAIGSLTATIQMSIRAADLTKCDGWMCENQLQECELTAKIPVLPPAPHGGGHYMDTTVSTDGKQSAYCENTFGGYEHRVRLTVYATKDPTTGALKLYSQSRSGKAKVGGSDATTDNSASTIFILPSNQPSFSIQSYLSADVSNQFGKNQLSDTSGDINTTITFSSLEVAAP